MSLIAEIEAFLTEHGMAPSRFGKLARREPSMVQQLRAGREMRPTTAAQIRAFMRDYVPQSAPAANRHAERSRVGGGECPHVDGPAPPSGLVLFNELANAALANHQPLLAYVKPLVFGRGNAKVFLSQLKAARHPRPATIARVRALIAGLPLPAGETRQRGHSAAIAAAPRRDPTALPGSSIILGGADPASWRAQPVHSPLAERIRAIGREVETEQRHETIEHATPSLQQAIRQAVEEWPQQWARVRALAGGLELLPGEVFQRALETGLTAIERELAA